MDVGKATPSHQSMKGFRERLPTGDFTSHSSNVGVHCVFFFTLLSTRVKGDRQQQIVRSNPIDYHFLIQLTPWYVLNPLPNTKLLQINMSSFIVESW